MKSHSATVDTMTEDPARYTFNVMHVTISISASLCSQIKCTVHQMGLQMTDNSSLYMNSLLYIIITSFCPKTLVPCEYADESERLKTFTADFPADSPVTPSALAEAGLFFTGITTTGTRLVLESFFSTQDLTLFTMCTTGTGDNVQCYYCHTEIKGWKSGDDPWKRHVYKYAKCSNIQAVKGEEYIKQVFNIIHVVNWQTRFCIIE